VGIGPVLDDDGAPALNVRDISVQRASSGTTNAVFTITLSLPSTQNVTVQYATVNGTALSGRDYQTRTGTALILAGNTSATVSVPIIGGTNAQPTRFFFLNLTVANNATIARAQGVCTIFDDHGQPAITIGDVSVFEGNVGSNHMANFPI